MAGLCVIERGRSSLSMLVPNFRLRRVILQRVELGGAADDGGRLSHLLDDVGQFVSQQDLAS